MHDEDDQEGREQNKIIKVQCDECDKKIDLHVFGEEVSREERKMGAEVQYDSTGEATCACGNEITYKESEWEYPEGCFNHREGPEITGGTLL